EVRLVSVSEETAAALGLGCASGPARVPTVIKTVVEGVERVGVDFEAPPKEAGAEQPRPAMTFLDDQQVRKVLEAVQGASRSSVMQAPKVLLANGQAGTVDVLDTHYFVTGVDVERKGEQVIFRPKNEPFTTGFGMKATPVVSADRRFVEVALKIEQKDLASAQVPVIPFMVPPDANKGQASPFVQFVQQPAFATVNVEKTVTIPDGGTVLLGGLRKVGKVHEDREVPVLSKIPHVNRL